MRVVEAHPAVQALGGVGDQAALDHHALEVRRHLAFRPLRVAEVGEEQSLLGADDHEPARAGEPGQPAHVGAGLATGLARRDEVAHQELVEALLGDEGREPVGARVGAHLSNSPFSSSSASR